MSTQYANVVLDQRPAPHACLVRHVGDSIRITLTSNHPMQGKAFVRTNLGNAAIQRLETIYAVEMGTEPLGRDWSDLAMRKLTANLYEIRLPLTEVGLFEFKCFFQLDGTGEIIWPRGDNAHIKVITALGAADNTIYNAFVRQFGKNIQGDAGNDAIQEAAALLDKANFTVIPPSGTFRAFKSKLDVIINQMGFRILQFLPIHPTPTVYARMGRFGSPFAPLDFLDVDPAMAEFDQRTTPLEQFQEIVDQIHARRAMVFLDLPIDHTGWASVLQSHHPEWFKRTNDGAFESPGAWGVVWADLCKLDFNHKDLWKRLASIFISWCQRGVDGFRCDAGYMIPAPAWKYIVAKVRQQFPDTIFFLEGLGGGMDATTALLNGADLDWAYSEFFQNYSKQELQKNVEFSMGYSNAHGALVNFAETHDNDRLAAKSPAWAKLRVTMAALFSPAGCFGIANGVEWYATEKIDVHGARSLNWGAKENMVDWIAMLTNLLKKHPAFWGTATSRVPYGADGIDAVGLLRIPMEDLEHSLMVVACTRTDAGGSFKWHFEEFDAGTMPIDLLTGKAVPATLDQCLYRINLKPGQVVCLCKPGMQTPKDTPYNAIERQILRSIALRLRVAIYGNGDLVKTNVEEEAFQLFQNPWKFLHDLLQGTQDIPMVQWSPDSDMTRPLLLPADFYLIVVSEKPFIAAMDLKGTLRQKYYSAPMSNGKHFALFLPPKQKVTRETPMLLRMCIFGEGGQPKRFASPLTLLPIDVQPTLSRRITHQELTHRHCALATNIRGSYGHVRGMWGNLEGHYDGMLVANQCPDFPADRTVVLARMRTWLIHHDYAQEINFNCQLDFSVIGKNAAAWHFIVPSGMGGNAYITIKYELDPEKNLCRLLFTRCPPPEESDIFKSMDADSPITLLLRPDVDDACNHNPTLAYKGAEHDFPRRVTAQSDGFLFQLSSGNRLESRASRGCFQKDDEWAYSVHGKMEEERALQADRDLYSPGYYRVQLTQCETAVLEFALLTPEEPPLAVPAEPKAPLPFHEPHSQIPLREALENAMDAFVVQRKPLKTVIAGYPWFLDWGRDTLICLRGLIASGRLEDSLAIIKQFASFEEKGTIPNMISGNDVSNRETTDAPLWLFNAVAEYIKAVGQEKAQEVLSMQCGDRTLLDVLKSIVMNYKKGTNNGIYVDKESMLVFSPAHYTWMDTNYPAGTPRQGYPIEIQALWFQALQFLAQQTKEESYQADADAVKASILKYYPSKPTVGLADCLHANPGTPAARAVADDACRPNQIFALTASGLIEDKRLRETIIDAAGHLLVPGAMRTLADQKVDYKLPIYNDGKLLNNPEYPYWGEYKGDENTRRKPAYHNGTAWPWLLPSFCEAIIMTYGDVAKPTALALLHTTASLMRRGCVGHLAEIVDGDYPNATRGCSAQAWSVTEAYRLLRMLD